jgi:hypothetical protein
MIGTTGLTWDSDNLPVALRDSLGFGSRGPGATVNDNAIGQILADAFVSSPDDVPLSPSDKAKSGREFLEGFRSGEAPGWILETCRSFCQEELVWRDELDWPKCLTARAENPNE